MGYRAEVNHDVEGAGEDVAEDVLANVLRKPMMRQFLLELLDISAMSARAAQQHEGDEQFKPSVGCCRSPRGQCWPHLGKDAVEPIDNEAAAAQQAYRKFLPFLGSE